MDLDVTAQPVGVPISLPNFLVLPGGISFELTQIDAGVFGSADCLAAPAPGQTCTPLAPPPKSPFNLMNTAVGSTASFTIRGIATMTGDTTTPPSTVLGTFTTQFTGRNYQSMLQTISTGGTVRASYSANFIVEEVPEPSTAYLALGGFILAAAGILRRRLVGVRRP
ncbi:MAG TPA: PEP-CTERM sorting domain-containing protein [Bryobacteraceae bacterium]|nr:PEP-CTERM sorting domain-containing protein [Bryobacteraceae bacterium]